MNEPKPDINLEFEAILATPEGQEFLRCEREWLEAGPTATWTEIGGMEAEMDIRNKFNKDRSFIGELVQYIRNTRLHELIFQKLQSPPNP